MNHEDSLFMKHFSWVLIGLVIFTVAIIVLANLIHNTLTPSENPTRAAKKLERIQPIAAVYVGNEGLAAAQAAVQAAANATDTAAEEPAGAFDGSMDGEYIYQQVCAACHATGAAGAPKLEAGAWDDRLPKGMDQLVSNALNGIGVMPAKGGRGDLSEAQIRVTVEWMLDRVQ